MKRPQALRLCEVVDYLREPSAFQREAAAELRRLHDENERLHKKLTSALDALNDDDAGGAHLILYSALKEGQR